MQFTQLSSTDLSASNSGSTGTSDDAHRPLHRFRSVTLRRIAYLFCFISGAAAMYALMSSVPARTLAQSEQSVDATSASTADESADREFEPDEQVVDYAIGRLGTVRDPFANFELQSDSRQAHSAVSEARAVFDVSSDDSNATPVALVSAESNELNVRGLTEPAPGKYAKLPLATSQAIAFVDVKVGDRIKKGWQCFSHWESPERLQAMKTELEKRKKLLEVAKTRADAAATKVQRLKKLDGTLSAQEMQDAITNAAIQLGDFEAAQLAVQQAESEYVAMEFEFNQAFVTSPLDGVVVAVDVIPGERRQFGGQFRGVTILDARVLHCKCMLNQEQLTTLLQFAKKSVSQNETTTPSNDALKTGIRAEVGANESKWDATVAWIGMQADPATGLIPVALQVQNPHEDLRSGMSVDVTLSAKSP